MKTGYALAALAGLASSSAYKIELMDASYETDADVAAATGLAANTCELKGILGDGDWTALEAAYTGSKAHLAAKADLGTPFDGEYKDYYGSADFVHADLMHALKNTGGYAKMKDSAGGRAEGFEKGVVDQIAVKQVMHYLDLADAAAKADIADAAAIKLNWDLAFATYFGTEEMKCGIYARGQKRASNYNTWADTEKKVAVTNLNALKAFAHGVEGVLAGDLTKYAEASMQVRENVLTVYVQASLRYLYLLDVDVTDGKPISDHQGEGRAFWKTIEPLFANVAESGELKAGFDAIQTAYDLSVAPAGTTRYCTGKPFFATAPAFADKVMSMVGTFEYDAEWECPAGKKIGGDAPPASDASDASDEAEASSDSGAAALTGSFATLTAVVVAAFMSY